MSKIPVGEIEALTNGTPVASTSGTSIEFTGIPAGTKKITMSFVGVSISGASNFSFQIGDSGGFETTGYLGTGTAATTPASTSYTTSWAVPSASAANVMHGSIVFTLVDAATFTWAANGTFGLSNVPFSYIVNGSKSLSAELDRVRTITGNGTDTFDAGKVNIQYEA